MVKTDELLTTINMACPCCHQKAEIEFHRTLHTLPVPFLRLKKIGGIAGKCTACGQTFPYSNPSKLYRYLDKSGIPYQRSYLFNNLVTLSAPIIVLIALVAIISTIAPMVSPALDNALHNLMGASGDDTSPLVLYSFRTDGANQTTYATFKLSANSSPVDLAALNISIMKNGNLTDTSIWHYGNSSISWTGNDHTGSMLGYGDMANVIVNVSKYHFNGSDKIELSYQVLDTPAYLYAFSIPDRTISPGNNTTAVHNGTSYAILSGRVYINNMTNSMVLLTFSGPINNRSILSDSAGYYRMSLLPNITYSLAIGVPDMDGMNQTRSVTIVNNTTYDIRLYT